MSTVIKVASLEALCRLNSQILKQKLGLIHTMKEQFSQEDAMMLYSSKCSIVGASVGQHVRHSMDHIQLAAEAAANGLGHLEPIHYDIRERGLRDEHDILAAEERIHLTASLLEKVMQNSTLEPSHPVQACFMLSSQPTEYGLHSSVGRELGFAAHHAIHHMALVRIIAVNTIRLSADDLPIDLGRAPSTQEYDNRADGSPMSYN